jgi:cytoskeletal protein CcmA (bactofilin family)
MWKPTNQPATPGRPAEPERPSTSTAPTAPVMTTSEPAAVPRPVTTTTSDQATIGKSLVIKGEVTGSESLYIDGRVEGSINLSGNRVTIGRNGVVAANINAREIVVLGKVRGNLTASDRVDIRSDGSSDGRRSSGAHFDRRRRLLQGRHRHPQSGICGSKDRIEDRRSDEERRRRRRNRRSRQGRRARLRRSGFASPTTCRRQRKFRVSKRASLRPVLSLRRVPR